MSARRVALDVITAVTRSDAYANLLLPARIRAAGLSAADAALATELTYGTLRRQGYYDEVIAIAAGRPVERIDPEILDVLRLGAHQLLSMRTASHAAVNESVKLTRTVGSRSAVGFVNGVLRTLSRSSPEEWAQRVLGTVAGADDRLAAQYSHPAWIVRAFRTALSASGIPGDRLEDSLAALLDADNLAPRISLAALPGQGADHDRPRGVTELPYSPIGLSWPGGDPLGWPAVAAGRVRVQDEGSQLAALALSRARPIEAGERWLDLCAGPGGKSALLAAEAAGAGAGLIANEALPARAELVRRAVAPFSNVQVRVGDGRVIGTAEPDHYDRVLVDAPCSGLGALRRRPEARWRKRPADIAELRPLQRALLDSALGAVRPGGVVAYVTCSPHVAETRQIIAETLNDSGGSVQLLPTAEILAGVTSAPLTGIPDDARQIQLWPHIHGTDAMFITLLTKS